VAWHQTLWVETRTDMLEMHLRWKYMAIIGLVSSSAETVVGARCALHLVLRVARCIDRLGMDRSSINRSSIDRSTRDRWI
jgi:hypothetical protein